MMKVTVFTDGSSLGNPGPGGYGVVVVLHKEGKVMEFGGYEERTTNNRMELTGAITALAQLAEVPGKKDITLFTDSSYVINGITKWVFGWERNSWVTAAKQQVLNQDLWQVLLELVRKTEEESGISWRYVKGHAGIPGNERVDAIATSFASGDRAKLFHGPAEAYEKMIGETIADLVSPKWQKKGGSSSKSGKAYAYVSKIDGVIKVHKIWAECEARVKGKTGARFKKVLSASELDSLLDEWRG